MSGSGVYPFLLVILIPEYFSSNLGDLLIMSVTGNCLFLLISKKSSSSRNPETGNNVHPVASFIRGEIILKFLQLGAAGCQIGTRFVCANESIAHSKFKNIFIKSEARNAQISVKIDDRLPVIPVRAIENSATQNFISEQKKLINLVEKKEISLKDAQLSIEHFWAGSLKKAVIDGDVESGSLMAGQSASLVKKLQSVSEIFNELTQQMKSQINFEQKDSNNG